MTKKLFLVFTLMLFQKVFSDNVKFLENSNSKFYFASNHSLCENINSSLSLSLDSLLNHINGSNILSTTDILVVNDVILENSQELVTDFLLISKAFQVVNLYEENYAPLFTLESSTYGGFTRDVYQNLELEYTIFNLMQAIIDYSYSKENINNLPSFFNGRYFRTSDFFPGAAEAPLNSEIEYERKVYVSQPETWGINNTHRSITAIRPTGCYLAPGTVVKVTVPDEMLNLGVLISIGAHTWDLENRKSVIKRLDRVVKNFEITENETYVSNPLGGGIYIRVPYGVDLGVQSIQIQNAIESPYFAITPANQTTLEEWQNEVRLRQAPWADFESDQFVQQVPTKWIYAFDDPKTYLEDWDKAIIGINKLQGLPEVREKHILYLQQDVTPRASFYAPGYPQSHTAYDPYNTHEDGNYLSSFHLEGAKSELGIMSTIYHELGHSERIYGFLGQEYENIVNFLQVAALCLGHDYDIDTAYSQSYFSQGRTIDGGILDWMSHDFFLNKEQYRDQNITVSEVDNSRDFKLRHIKYAHIAKLFGWEILQDYFYDISDRLMNGESLSPYSNSLSDERICKMSSIGEVDLRPLLHFWNLVPLDFESTATCIEETHGLTGSTVIYDELIRIKSLASNVQGVNVAKLYGIASQSSTSASNREAIKAIDGNTNGNHQGNSIIHTNEEDQPWWQLDFESNQIINTLTIYNRTDDCCISRMDNYTISITNTNGETLFLEQYEDAPNTIQTIDFGSDGLSASSIKIQLNDYGILNLAEVEVYTKSVNERQQLVQDIIDLYFPNGRPEETLSVTQNRFDEKDSLIIYPNPVNDILRFSLIVDDVLIYDLKGNQLIKKSNVKTVDVSKIIPGNYFVKLNYNKQIKVSQIIIK